MTDRRKELQAKLEELLGSRNVYFQPPENFKMKYDCIVYKRDPKDNRHADNRVFAQRQGWMITHISTSPISPEVQKLSELPTCRPEQSFVSDNLYHNVFHIYF